MRKWFGPVVDSWKMLRAYPLARALPQQRHAEWEQAPVRVGGTGGVYMCGDYRETASIQGALASGRRAAEAVIHDLAGQGRRIALLTQGIRFAVKSRTVQDVPAKTLLSSSMAEHSAVNRRVVGSSPT